MRLILASGSATRQAMLRQAGIEAATVPPDLDEAAAKAGFAGGADDLALALAEAKALRVAAVRGEALVIGADQVLVCDGERFDKPADPAGAAAQLRALRGRTHELVTAVCVAQGERLRWRHVAVARLRMRDFSEEFLRDYLAAEGEAACQAVGAYRLEGLGVQLFEAVEGDFFTILGLPLLPLLGFLRQAGAVAG